MAKTAMQCYNEAFMRYLPDSYSLDFTPDVWQSFLKMLHPAMVKEMNDRFYFHGLDLDLVPDNWDEVGTPEEATSDISVEELMYHGLEGATWAGGWMCEKGSLHGISESDLRKIAADLS